MKIAIPTRENNVDGHFGQCEYYTIFSVEENKIVKKEILESPQGCGCKSNIAATLQQKGVKQMLAGNMGAVALSKLNAFGIEVTRGCDGNVDELVAKHQKGEIKDTGEPCGYYDLPHEH